MISALAGVVAVDRLSRTSMGPATDKGRSTFVMHGEPTEAEQHWGKVLEQHRRTPTERTDT
jgi:hypothetical protein